MPTPQELKERFWSSLRSDMTLMLGIEGEGHARPMTAQFDGDPGPIWFFASRESALAQALAAPRTGFATYASKGHELFAAVHGRLSLSDDPAVIERLWNRFVAAWFEGGKDDPKLALIRFDADSAEIWEDASSLVASVKLLVGADPKEDYKAKVAQVTLP